MSTENLYDEIETRPSLESEGITVTIGSKLAVVIARAGGTNRAFDRAREAIGRPFTRQIQAGIMKLPETVDKVLKPAYARAVVKDFLTVKGDKTVSGIPPYPGWKVSKEELNENGLLPVTEENILRVFREPSLSFIWDVIVEEADKNANFRAADTEARAGN